MHNVEYKFTLICFYFCEFILRCIRFVTGDSKSPLLASASDCRCCCRRCPRLLLRLRLSLLASSLRRSLLASPLFISKISHIALFILRAPSHKRTSAFAH